MLKRTKELTKTVETQVARIEELEAVEAVNQYLARKVSVLEAIVSKQKTELEAKERINNINLASLWDERRENEKLRQLLNEKNQER